MKSILTTTLLAAGLSLAAASCMNPNAQNAPAQDGAPFKYLMDEFADLKIIRYQVPGWDALSLREKEYVYCLSQAALSGRDIIWDQNFRYNLAIRKCLENILNTYTGDRTTEEFQQFTVYAKRVFFSNGIHHHYAEYKILPQCSAQYIQHLIENSAESDYGTALIPVMCNPEKYRLRRASAADGDLVTASSVNFYENVDRDQAVAFYRAMEDPKDPRPISYGLNSRLVGQEDGSLFEEVYCIDGGLYSTALAQVCTWLERAAQVAQNPEQVAYINKLIEYYHTGDLRTWDEYNVLWVQDNASTIDFNNGFIEDYNDPLGMKGAWGSNVSLKDVEASKRTEVISQNAQWFEDHSPVDPRFKKAKVTGVSAKVINMAMLGGDNFPSTPIGINLPNANWIRKEYGSKSVTIANITHAYSKAGEESPKSLLGEFSWDQAEVDLQKKYGSLTSDLHTDLHECLGHGSGQLLEGVSPSALAEYSSALEEARADLFALYYLADPQLVTLGILPDMEAYKAEYNNYIRNGLFTQLVRIELGQNLTESHMQNRQLIATWCYEQGLEDKVIERKVRDGKSYFVINDYAKLRELFARLLAQVQRIKSEGDYAAGKALVEGYGVRINPQWHAEVKERYAQLELKPYGGFMNPVITPVEKNGKVVDYALSYPTDYLQQMLDYGRDYSFLEATL